MGILTKLKLLLKLNKSSKVVVEEVEKVVEAKKKSGLKSTEFWGTVLVSVGSVAASVTGILPPLYAAIAVSGSTVAYTLSRGLAKKTDPNGAVKPGYKASEFYVGLLNDLGSLLAAVSGAVPPELAIALMTISRVAYSISRGLAKQ